MVSKGRGGLGFTGVGVVLGVAFLSLAACATRSEVAGPAEGPPRLPLKAAQDENTSSDRATTPAQAPAEAIAPRLAVAVREVAPKKGKSAESACPDPSMILVEGEYCTEVKQICAEWMESPSNPAARCKRFEPSQCIGQRVHKRFCIDKDEYTAKGETLPQGKTSWTAAAATCESEGKRLCKETEWEFACEGESMVPYPIGQERDSTKCNYDQMELVNKVNGKLNDLRKPSAELDKCVSPFGVRSMTGNVDEWTVRDRTNGEFKSAMKGGWWMAARNRCRPATTAHDEHYKDVQTGFRCCSDAK